jgi:regulatory protein
MPETITERKPRPRDRVEIRLSGGRFFAIPQAAAEMLAVGQELSDEDVTHLDGIAQYTRGRDKAMRMLALRSRSKREIDDAMRTLGLHDTIRTGIVRELEESGLIDDARFAREFVAVKKDVRRVGPHRLRYDLGRLGLPRAAVDKALSVSARKAGQMARALATRHSARHFRTKVSPTHRRHVAQGLRLRGGKPYRVRLVRAFRIQTLRMTLRSSRTIKSELIHLRCGGKK